MKIGNKIFILLFMALFLIVSIAPAQIEDNLKRYTGENGKGYMKPLVDGFGLNINRGWYQTAKIPTMGIRLRIGLVAMMAPIPDKDKTFKATTSDGFTPAQKADASTIFGSEVAQTVTGTGGSVYVFPGGLNMNTTAFAVPQATVGIMGSEAIVRFFSYKSGDAEIGDLSVFGLGIRHSISQYLILFPVDISVGAFWQKINLGDDLVAMTTLHYGVQASKGFGPLTLYGGVGFDNSSATVKYTYQDLTTTLPVEFDIDGDKGLEITTGIGFNLILVHLSADASFGTRTAFAINASFGL